MWREQIQDTHADLEVDSLFLKGRDGVVEAEAVFPNFGGCEHEISLPFGLLTVHNHAFFALFLSWAVYCIIDYVTLSTLPLTFEDQIHQWVCSHERDLSLLSNDPPACTAK